MDIENVNPQDAIKQIAEKQQEQMALLDQLGAPDGQMLAALEEIRLQEIEFAAALSRLTGAEAEGGDEKR